MNPTNVIQMPVTAKEVAETLADGTQIPVTYQDGRTEITKIRRVPRNEFVPYASAIMDAVTDERPECAFYANKPVEWTDEITDESFDAVMQEGRRLNFTRWAAWFARRQETLRLAQVSHPALKAAAEAAVAKVLQKT